MVIAYIQIIYPLFSRRLFYLTEDSASNIWSNNELHTCGPDKCKHPLQSIYEPKILAFGEDEEGRIVFVQ